MTREKDIETYLRDEVTKMGGIALKFIPTHHVGMPDRLILLPKGLTLWVEVKATNGRLRKIQIVRHNELRALGQQVWVVNSFESVDNLLAKYRDVKY